MENKDFAKLFKYKKIGQVLATKEIDEEIQDEKCFAIRFRLQVEIGAASFTISGVSEEDRDKAFESLTEESVFELIRSTNEDLFSFMDDFVEGEQDE